ncbi:ribonuclease type III, nuclear [Tolypothrix sp. PCC 7601]|nr:ribonuclease type III, nuclear [Tolypothrix sp. PCC 7601]
MEISSLLPQSPVPSPHCPLYPQRGPRVPQSPVPSPQSPIPSVESFNLRS